MKRKTLGLLVLILGTSGLTLWGARDWTPQIETKVRGHAEAALAQFEVGDQVTLAVSGRDIDISGLASNEGGASAVKDALNAVSGMRVLRADDLADLPIASPFVLTAQKKDGAFAAQGAVPNQALRDQLATVLGTAAQDLTLAAGAPDGWADNAVAGLNALAQLQSGNLSVEGQTVTLQGEVRTPAELAQVDADLADVAMLIKDIKVLDDGLPVAYRLNLDRDGAGTLAGAVEGKLPFGVTPQAMAGVLGLPDLSGAAITAQIGDAGDIGYLPTWAAVLPQIDTLVADIGPNGRQVRAQIKPGADADAIATALAAGGFSVAIDMPAQPEPAPEPKPAPEPAPVVTPLPALVTPALSTLGFEISPTGCQGASDALLAETTIIFLPNLDTLDASAEAVLAQLAAIARDCAGGNMTAEIGGHTDTSGDAAENLALSARRAEAVRAALIAAGVPEDQLTAKGYGSAQPIAENETKEGRAKNRRTTVVWTQ